MNVVVEAGPLTAGSCLMESKTITEIIISAPIGVSIVSSFSTASVISVGGNSISSITPETNLLGVWAAA